MRYYATYDESNKLIAIGSGFGGTEITKEEYETMLSESKDKAKLSRQLYGGDITVSDIPVKWQEEIQCRVEQIKKQQEICNKHEISPNELYCMLEEVL